MEEEKIYLNIFLRYILVLFFIWIFLTKFFLETFSLIFTYLSFIFLNLFTNVNIYGNSLYLSEHKYLFEIVKSCIAPSAYILISFIFLTIKIKLKKSLELILKASFIFTLFNLFRIFLLMLIHVFFGKYLFDKLHLIFYQGLSGVIVSLIIIYFLHKNKIKKNYPIFSDIKFLIKKIKIF